MKENLSKMTVKFSERNKDTLVSMNGKFRKSTRLFGCPTSILCNSLLGFRFKDYLTCPARVLTEKFFVQLNKSRKVNFQSDSLRRNLNLCTIDQSAALRRMRSHSTTRVSHLAGSYLI